MMKNFKIDIYDTGNGTAWCFEVFKDGKLIGSSHEHKSRDEALLEVVYLLNNLLAGMSINR